MTEIVRKVSDIPTAIGFGISDAAQAKKMSAYADGVIMGSAIVKLCEKYAESAPEEIYKLVKEVKSAIKLS
jgi:tryptophan synthase alpha chain